MELAESTRLDSSSSVMDIYAPAHEAIISKDVLEVEAITAQLEGKTFTTLADAHKLPMMADAERAFTTEGLNIEWIIKTFDAHANVVTDVVAVP